MEFEYNSSVEALQGRLRLGGQAMSGDPSRAILPGRALFLLVISFGSLLLGACARVLMATPASNTGVALSPLGRGAEMILVPAGEFLMGSAATDPKAGDDEQPQHTVVLDAFWIDRTEVPNVQYVQFLDALGGHTATCGGHDCLETKGEEEYSHIFLRAGRYAIEQGFEDHPATEVTWYGAQAYCEWAGARLPTEAEWEKAARGVDGRLYPWGDEAPDCAKAQFGECGAGTVPVGSRPGGASPYGVLDMAGNVWEWVADWYDPAYYGSSPVQNPQGPDSGVRKVFRGGSWGYLATFLRTSDRARNRPTYAGFNIGFRCAAPPPASMP